MEKGKNEEKYRLYLARLERRMYKVSANNIRACFVKQRNVEKMEVEGREVEQEIKEDADEVEQGAKVDIVEVDKEVEALEEEKKIAEKKREGKASSGKNTNEIFLNEQELGYWLEKRSLDTGLNAVSIAKKIKELKDARDVPKKTLKRKQDNMKAVQKLRKEKKVVGERLREEHPELAKALKVWMVLEMIMAMIMMMNLMIFDLIFFKGESRPWEAKD